MSPLSEPTKLILARNYVGIDDPDAAAYIAAVETADGQVLEIGVQVAIHSFVKGCKADGIWNAIKASCILAGARSLAGALVPLVGPAPTNFNFVAGDYNRKTGLVGNGSTKYLDSNRAVSADPQNNKHASVYACRVPSVATRPILGMNRASTNGSGTVLIYNTLTRLNDSSLSAYTAALGLIGISRSQATLYSRRNNLSLQFVTQSSFAPQSESTILYADSLLDAPLYSDSRLAFYSIGEALDLALLDARVTTLINAFAAAIP